MNLGIIRKKVYKMKTIKLDDPVFNELHIITKAEYEKIPHDYKSTATFDKKIKCAFLPGYGTTLFFENRHFIIIDDKNPLKHFYIWRNHKIIGECDITTETKEKANKATNAKFYFGNK